MMTLGAYKQDTLKRHIGYIASVDMWDFEGATGSFSANKGISAKFQNTNDGDITLTDFHATLSVGDSNETAPRYVTQNGFIIAK